METNDQAQPVPTTPAPDVTTTAGPKSPRRFRLPALLLLVGGLTVGSAALIVHCLSGPNDPHDTKPIDKEPPKGVAWTWDEVFPHWPKNQKPDFVIVLTGQTYGYLQKCGCSDPQKGGLERRFNFIQGLQKHGVETIPLDLGDVSPEVSKGESKLLHPQALLKYQTAMRIMKAMGYRNVGLGKEEFALGLHEVLGEYSLQLGNEQPELLAANLIGFRAGKNVLPRKVAFPNAKGDDTAIRSWNLIPTKSKLTLGVVGVVGQQIVRDVKNLDSKLVFEPSSDSVSEALNTMKTQKNPPNLNILLYAAPRYYEPDVEEKKAHEDLKKDNDKKSKRDQFKIEDPPWPVAEKAAKTFPQFRIVVCESKESEPPGKPTILKDPAIPQLDTMLIEVGHKGQNLGVVGVFKNKEGGFDLHYQLVTMTPMFETPNNPQAEKDNLALQELENYSKLVRDRGYLTQNRKGPHPLQVSNKEARYVGSQACASCHNQDPHGDSWQVYNGSKHAHAYDALEKIAKKPSLRNFDGECIRCHTVGYDYNTGFVDAQKTPQLMNVGCESCHGPGSQHVANPTNKKFALELSPWKVNPGDQMPSVQKLQALLAERDAAKRQAILTQQENLTMLRVDRTCQQCHNQENDPHFQIETFWPKVAHSSKGKGNANVPKDGGPVLTPGGPALTPPK